MRAGVDLAGDGPDDAHKLPGHVCGDLALMLAHSAETAGVCAEVASGPARRWLVRVPVRRRPWPADGASIRMKIFA